MKFDVTQDENLKGQRIYGARAAVEPVTASRTLIPEDLGVILRYEGSDPITLTVPKDAPEGENYAVAVWGSGAVNIAAADGATNRSATTASSGQYKLLSIIVLRNEGGGAAEFKVVEA